MTDDDRREYLRHLEEIAAASFRSRQIDGVSWALIRHATPTERFLVRLWLWILGAR